MFRVKIENKSGAKKMAVANLLVLAAVIMSTSSQAAEYCYRHIYNNSSTPHLLVLCNRNDDCSPYNVPAGKAVKYAIPDDVRFSTIFQNESCEEPCRGLFRKESMSFTVEQLFFFYRSDSAVWEKNETCRINKVGWEGEYSLDNYPQKAWIDFNEPSNGDINIREP